MGVYGSPISTKTSGGTHRRFFRPVRNNAILEEVTHMLDYISRKSRLLTYLAAGIALGFVGTTATAQAQEFEYTTPPVTVPTPPVSHAGITCNTVNNTVHHTSFFSFDISWVNQASGQYMLADRSHGFPTVNNERGMITNPNSGDILLIDTDNPGNGFSVM